MSNISSSSRDGSCERAESRMVKHQHSFSDTNRSSIPMWDSSDPDRNPPPLPLNPGVNGSPITRSNTSARIEEAAALIQARARENAPSGYTSNPPPSASPDRNIMKPQHRRMQTIQNGNIGRLSDSLERRSPDKGLRTSRLPEIEEQRKSRSIDRKSARASSASPTPVAKSSARLSQTENTPPYSSMLALQTIRNRQEPLGDITNVSSPLGHTSYTFDALSTQILSLTSIATNLQKELTSLNKRSKDNASDLIGLKEAANVRDEDIRKTLRDLVSGLDHKLSSLDTRLLTAPDSTRSATSFGLYLDDKAHNGSPGRKGFSLPRIPSPSTFSAALDRDLTSSPSIACVDGAASIALLEKVLREMGTKDGQENIMKTLENVRVHILEKSQSLVRPQSTIDPVMMAKLEDILVFMKDMKEGSGSKALVRAIGNDQDRRTSQMDLYLDSDSRSGPMAKLKNDSDRRASNASTMGSDMTNEEIVKMLKSVKQSLSQGGGLTNEVKVLVRELRGEVLGMGREIAKKLEMAETNRRGAEIQGSASEEVAEIVTQGLAELKEHMHHLVRENRRQSSDSPKPVVDTKEVVRAVQNAMVEMPRSREEPIRDREIERRELLDAVKEAWEECKPEIALEHFGLERDEILETLKEGLKSYQTNQQTNRDAGATYDEVLEAVRCGLADFKPPQIETEAGVTREEILIAVREVLENFDWPLTSSAPSQLTGSEISRNEVLSAIKEGMLEQSVVSKEVEFNREDLFDAIKACLEGDQNPLGGMGERVVEAMHEFLGSMKTEFQQYSAANGKDTEQVLDAMKDGFEDLRADIESYVDRAADVTGKDEIIETVRTGFESMQIDIEKGFANRNKQGSTNTPELLDAMEKEFQHLRDSINKSLARGDVSSDKEEILDALRDLSDDRQSALSSNSEDIVRLVKDELEHMRTTLATTLIKNGNSIDRGEILDAIHEGFGSNRSPTKADGNESILSNTSELLDAFQDGVDNIRSDMKKFMDRPVDLSTSYEILDALKAGIQDVRADITDLKENKPDASETATARGQAVVVRDENTISTEIEALKVMITQLRIKVEALDTMQPPVAESFPAEARVHKDDLDEIHTAIQGVHDSINRNKATANSEQTTPRGTASKEDTDAIETLLRNVKAQLDDFVMPDVQTLGTTAHLDRVEDLLSEIKTAVEDSEHKLGGGSNQDDITLVELLVKEVQTGVEDLQNKLSSLTKGDGILSKTEINFVESLCLDIKNRLEILEFPPPDELPSKRDVEDVKDSLKAFRDQVESDNDLAAQAFEARKVEHGGLASKIDDMKGVLGDLRDELVDKIDGSADGIVELNKVLGMHHDNMSSYATASSLTELSDLVRSGLETQREHHASTKTDSEERDATLFMKHDEISSELRSVIQEKFNELMTKYDDAQLGTDAKLHSFEQHSKGHLEASNRTGTIVEDLKSLMDTLGSTVSETCDRLSDDSKTVFGRVEEVNNKIDGLQNTNTIDHGITREEIVKTHETATRIEISLSKHQPEFMAAIREVLGIVGQHYEQSQQQAESFVRATEEIKTGVNAIPSSIPPLLPALPAATPSSPQLTREIPIHKEYDDTQVHDKLNNLISHASIAKETFHNIENHHKNTQEAFENMKKMDEIHEKVLTSANEISSMVATQTRLMAEFHDSKTNEATEAAIALEKRTAQKDQVESEIVALREEKEALAEAMATLRKEHNNLSSQTKKLTRDVAKLETALTIRQEEMRDMNIRAESLERRILEGLMNNARSSKAARSTRIRKITPAERDAAMSLKRVPSSASTITNKTSIKDSHSAIGSVVGMALKKRSPLSSSGNSNASPRVSGVDRRILSTSHITGSRGRDVPERALILAPAPKSGFSSLKRSQSVKSNPSTYSGGRKASWNGIANMLADKENQIHEDDLDSNDDNVSESGTERRTSFTGTVATYSDSMIYGSGSSVSRNSDRTVSYASSIGGTLNGQTESITEEDEGEEEAPESENHEDEGEESDHADQDEQQQLHQAVILLEAASDAATLSEENELALAKFEGHEAVDAEDHFPDLTPPPLITDHGIKYHEASDSGLGTEPPTADFERIGEAQEYFDMSRAELQT